MLPPNIAGTNDFEVEARITPPFLTMNVWVGEPYQLAWYMLTHIQRPMDSYLSKGFGTACRLIQMGSPLPI